MLASLYNGNVHVWNTETQTLVKSFEVCDLPVRCARFVARKSWIVVGSDDMQVCLYIFHCLQVRDPKNSNTRKNTDAKLWFSFLRNFRFGFSIIIR